MSWPHFGMKLVISLPFLPTHKDACFFLIRRIAP
jgi:hypothetical protein